MELIISITASAIIGAYTGFVVGYCIGFENRRGSD